jgi:hemolysin III
MNISINDYRMMYAQREVSRQSQIKALSLPTYTFNEEMLNCVTHALGALMGIVGWIMSLKLLIPACNPAATISMSVFFVTMIILYGNSALYHGWKLSTAKKKFQIMDHCSIFLLITGTYAPYTLMVMNNLAGKIIFAVVVLTSVLGIALNVINLKKYAYVSMACYLTSGWCIVLAYRDIAADLSHDQLFMLVAGGVVYTVGAIFYGLGNKIRYMHTIWHLFVLGGTIFHFASLYSFILYNL